MNWNEGYFTGIEYTHGYYRDLSPGIIDFALLNRRLTRPASKPLRYLELGYGQGMSLNIHAAANAGEFWGTDFTPQQTTNALHLARNAGSDVHLLNDSFEELAARTDLPEFDVITMHGIWSWVSPDVRKSILHLLHTKLAPGGALFISYNCQPGWAATFPMARMIDLHARMNADKPAKARVDGALDYLEQLAEAGGRFFLKNPEVREVVKHLRQKDYRYVAHEYIQQHMQIQTFADVAHAMGSVRLSYAASALMLEHVHGLHFTPAGGQILAGISDVILRETTRDYLVNAQFRCDIYTKGAVLLSPFEQRGRIASTYVALTTPPYDVKLEANGGLGTLTLKPEIYNPILELLAAKKAPLTMGAIAQSKDLQGLPADHILEAITVLIGLGALTPARAPEQIAEARDRCKALNRALRARAETTDESMMLASPVTGTGVPVPQIYQFFMTAEESGLSKKEDICAYVHQILRRDDPLRPHDPPLPKDKTLHATLLQDLDGYRKRLPVYRALELC